jgi:hypothetical protein
VFLSISGHFQVISGLFVALLSILPLANGFWHGTAGCFDREFAPSRFVSSDRSFLG